MPLVGGSGTGNTAGSNPAGTGTSLNYIGRDPTHAYAYSGIVAATDTETTLLEFSIGSEYIVGQIQLDYFTDIDNDFGYRIYFDDQQVMGFVYNASSNQTEQPRTIIIPSYTKVKVTAQNLDASTARENLAIITGRVYA